MQGEIRFEKSFKILFKESMTMVLGTNMIWQSKHNKLYNILKGINAPITVYIDTKHYGLEQCNGRAALATESWKDCSGRVGLSFHWDVYGIEAMVGEKMISSVLVGLQAPDCRHLALGQASSGCPCAKWGCKPQSADTWCWGCHGR